MSLLALIHVHDLLRIDGKLLVRVDHHAEEARVRLPTDKPNLLPFRRQEKDSAKPSTTGHFPGSPTWQKWAPDSPFRDGGIRNRTLASQCGPLGTVDSLGLKERSRGPGWSTQP